MITFKEFLDRRRISNTARGDFTKEARQDPAMAAIESWPQLRAHIYKKATGQRVNEIIDAAEPIWKAYRATVLKARREN
jgi:hypothetical protein